MHSFYQSSMKDSTGNSTTNKVNHGIDNIMESMVKITLGGAAGTMIGLSLEKRLEAMKLTTAESIAAVARRKRGKPVQSNLVATWALSCLVFCTIIEASRVISPSTRVLNQMNIKTSKSPLITISDYCIGGSIAGAFSSQTYTVMKFAKPRGLFLIGFALGGLAGTFQAAIDYGTARLEITKNEFER